MEIPGPIDYPFANDGLYYLGKLSESINQSNIIDGLNVLKNEQGFIFFIFHRLLGIFNSPQYPYFFSQLALSLLIILIIVYQEKPRRAFPISRFLCLTLLLSSFGFFSAYPGNLFDFRLDISASLILLAAQLSLYKKHPWSCVLVPLAIYERFHNISALAVTVFCILIIQIVNTKNFRFRNCFTLTKEYFLDLRITLFTTITCLLIRWDHFKKLFLYYRTVQLSSNSDYISSWDSPGFFTYYFKVFLRDYLTLYNTYIIILTLILLIFFKKLKNITSNYDAKNFLIISTSIFLILMINPTRNNGGVLRYALVSGVYSIYLLLKDFIKVYGNTFKLKVFLYLLVLSTISLFSFYANFDYFGIRRFKYSAQIDNAMSRIINRAHEKGLKDINIGSFYSLDLNFNKSAWEYYFLKTQTPRIPINHLFGDVHRIVNIENDVAAKLKHAQFLATPTNECYVDYIPADKQLSTLFTSIGDLINTQCKEELAKINLGKCLITVRECLNL